MGLKLAVNMARLAKIQSAPNHRDLRRQTTRALRRDRNAYWKAVEVSAANRPEWMKCYLNEMDASSQIKPDSYVDGKSTSRNFSITQHTRTPYFHHRIHQLRKTTLVKLTHPLWRRCALPSDSYAITEPLERMASQRRFARRASTPWAHGCTG